MQPRQKLEQKKNL